MNTLLQDIRYALRQLRRSPGFTLTTVLTLTLGVGVATAVFSVIDAEILRPLPYAHPERIVSIDSRSRSGYTQPASWPSFQDERTQTHAFQALAAYTAGSMNLETRSGETVELTAARSTDNLFQVLGIQPMLGRTYLPGEDQMGRNDVVVLSYEVWQTYFGGQRDEIGRAVHLDGRAFTVIGVMPAGFAIQLPYAMASTRRSISTSPGCSSGAITGYGAWRASRMASPSSRLKQISHMSSAILAVHIQTVTEDALVN